MVRSPVDICFGTRPSHAAFAKPIAATIALAMIPRAGRSRMYGGLARFYLAAVCGRCTLARARTRSLPPARQSAPSAARSRSARRGLHGSRRRKRGIAPSSQCSHANALQSRISSCASGRDFLPRFLLELPCCLKWRGCSPCTRGAAMWPYWLLPQSRIDFHPSAVLAEKRSSRGRFRMQRTNVSAWLVGKMSAAALFAALPIAMPIAAVAQTPGPAGQARDCHLLDRTGRRPVRYSRPQLR